MSVLPALHINGTGVPEVFVPRGPDTLGLGENRQFQTQQLEEREVGTQVGNPGWQEEVSWGLAGYQILKHRAGAGLL